METKKEKQTSIIIIVVAVIAICIILFEVLVNGEKFLDHLLTTSLALALFGTGIIQLNKINKEKK